MLDQIVQTERTIAEYFDCSAKLCTFCVSPCHQRLDLHLSKLGHTWIFNLFSDLSEDAVQMNATRAVRNKTA